MTTYRSTTLRNFTRHCPAALGFYEAGAPIDREIFATGIAAHAVLERLGRRARDLGRPCNEAEAAAVAQATTRTLIAEGRSFDGVPEPPLSPDDATAGRDLALDWHREHPESPTALYEQGLAMTLEGEACAYDDPRARYKGALDVLDRTEEGDEEWSGVVVTVEDHKSSWAADESELDSTQFRGYVVLAWLHHPDADLIRYTVNSLRMRARWSREIYPGDPEGRATLERWRRDVLLACDAADRTREARPGAGCMGCSYIYHCEHVTIAADGADAAVRFAAIEALRDAAGRDARLMAAESPIIIPGGAVGYHAKEKRTPTDDAYRTLALTWCNVSVEREDAWCAENGDILGLLKAMRMGVSQLDAIAKVLYGRGEQAARADFLDAVTTTVVDRRFGVERVAIDNEEIKAA